VSSWSIAQANLTSVGVLAFLFGVLAARVKSDVRLPDAIYQFLSIYLLFGIGLKGGYSLKSSSFSELLTPALTTVALGILIPLLAFLILKGVKKLNDIDRGSIAAHYGSTSLVTFSAGLLFLESNNIFVEGYAPALLTLLEIPGLIVGIYLASRTTNTKVGWASTLKEVLLGKTVLLLAGGLAIGLITTQEEYAKVNPFFVALLSGLLVLFLLHLGFMAGSSFHEIRGVGAPLAVFAIAFPLLSGTLGVAAGSAIGLSIGGATILGLLSASASYIAAPAAVAVALPQASRSLALMSSIGITFPFNLILGIPIFYKLAEVFG
jgi:uncharacterized protein